MYRKDNSNQIEFEDFYLPFAGKLRSDNRWVILSKQIPWSQIEDEYSTNFSDGNAGCPAKSARVALGALIIKERLGTTDRETVHQIAENPYLQFFLGFSAYKDITPFDDSLMTHFRKRFDKETLAEINALIVAQAMEQSQEPSDDDKDLPSNNVTLIDQIKSYHKRFGYYPESVHADKIYRTRDNRHYCKVRGIRLSGPPLGRPKKVTESNAEQLKRARQQHRQDELDRIAIEGKFGQGKRRFSLARVMAKLAVTSEVVIMVSFMVMNLEKILSSGLYFWLQTYLWISAAADRAAGAMSICTELTLDTDAEYQNVTA